MQYSSSGKVLRLRWSAACMDCSRTLNPGDRALWFHVADVGRCMTCAESSPSPTSDALYPALDGRPHDRNSTSPGPKAGSRPDLVEQQMTSAPAMTDGTSETATSSDQPPNGERARVIRLRRAAVCAVCGTQLSAGSEAAWSRTTRAARCIPCVEANRPLPLPHSPSIDLGTAGASARREHQKRAEREWAKKQRRIDSDREWRARRKQEKPVLGRIQVALTPKPTMTPESRSTKAWAIGAAGEERVAQVLEAATAIVLHDRRIPGTKANIDHIAVGPAGVYVIDAKKYTGRIEKRDVGGWWKADERLYVRGRDRTKLLDGMRHQLDVVTGALGAKFESIPVHGVLCFIGAEWPGFVPMPIRFGTVTCIWPKALTALVDTSGTMGRADMEAAAARLARALPPA